MDTERKEEQKWVTVARPGYQGSRREEIYKGWDEQYGGGNWRIAWETATGEMLTYEEIFRLYVVGYVRYFQEHPDEAKFLIRNFSYAYDETQVSHDEAFDPYALWEKPDLSNQFHHVALNLALGQELGLSFQGTEPIQVRGGKPGTPRETWPVGWYWHPGRIPCTRQDLIPQDAMPERKWWEDGTIEDLYQRAKVLQAKA